MAFKKEKELKNKSTNKTVKNTSAVAKEGAKASVKAGAKTVAKVGIKSLSKKAIIAIILSATVAVTSGLGFGLGFGLKKGNDTPPGNLNEIFASASTAIKAPEGVTPEDVTDAKMSAFHAFYAMNEMDSFVSHSVGATKSTGYTQNIKSRRVVSGNEIFKESISHSSLVKVGRRFFITGKNYVIHEADKVSSVDSVSWSNSASRISEEDYINAYGYVPSSITGYLFTEETILSAEYLGFNDGLYSFKYQLDPVEATKAMVIEMRTMANAKDYPKFERAELTIRMDENFVVKETVTNCRYKAKGFNCEENVTETFSDFNQGEIPNADFYRQYLDADISQQPDGPEQPATPVDYLAGGFAEYITGEKPLKANIDVQGTSTPISVDADVELNINMEDMEALTARVNVNSIAYSDLSLNDLFIGYQNNKIYLSIADFKGYGDIEQMSSIIENLIPLFVSDATDISNVLGDINLDSLMEDMTLEIKDGVATVSLPLSLAGLDINASLIFDDGDTIAFNKAVITLGDVTITATPDNDIDVEQIDTPTYNNVAPLFDIIDKDGNVKVEITAGDINALANFNLQTLTLDASIGDALIKFTNNTLYAKYGDLKAKLNVNDVATAIEKLSPIITSLTGTSDLLNSIDVESLVSGAIKSITTSTTADTLTVKLTVEGVDLSLCLNVVDGGYSIGSINAKIGEFDIKVSPTTKQIESIDANELSEYNDILGLLDIIDQNNNVNLTATIKDVTVDLSINLIDFTVIANADIYGKPLYAKFQDQKIYISFLGFNGYINVNDINGIVEKITAIIGQDFSTDLEIDVDSVVSALTITENNGLLTIATNLLGADVGINILSTDNTYAIKDIKATFGEIDIEVKPTTRTQPLTIPEGKYFNITPLLNIIDDNNEIDLTANAFGLDIDVNINLSTFVINAKTNLYGKDLFVKFEDNKIYLSYLGLNIYFDINDIDKVMNKITSITGSTEIALPDTSNITVQSILDGITVTNGEDLTINAKLFGFDFALALSTTDDNLEIKSISAKGEGIEATVKPNSKKTYQMPNGKYYNIVSILDLIDDNNEINLKVNAFDLDIDVNVDLDTFVVKAKTNLYGKDLFVKFEDNKIYLSYLGLNIYFDINDIETVMNKFAFLLESESTSTPSTSNELNVEDILNSITVTEDSTLNILANLFGIDASIIFNTTNDSLTLNSINAKFEDIEISVVPCDKVNVVMPEATYYNVVSILDLIDDNNEINLKVNAFGLDIDVNVDLDTFVVKAKTNLYGKDLFVKYEDNKIYISYIGLNLFFDINDIDKVTDKLGFLLGNQTQTATTNNEQTSIDIQSIINAITVTDGQTLDISANLFGFDIKIAFNTANDSLTLNSIALNGEGIEATVKPNSKAVYDMPETTYYDVVSVLDIIDENYNVNLIVKALDLDIKVNIDLANFVVKAQTNLYGKDLFVKFEDNKVYLSYIGLNVFFDINDIEAVMDKLAFLFESETTSTPSTSTEFDIKSLIDGISVEDKEKLSIYASIFGIDASVIFNTTDAKLTLNSINASVEGFDISVEPTSSLSIEMPEATYYDIVTLLDIIDSDNQINLKVSVLDFDIYANINLENMVITAKTTLYGKELYAKYENGYIYISYVGLNLYVNLEDINTAVEKLKPIVGEVDTQMPDLDIQSIIDGIKVVDGEILTISTNLFGVDLAVNLNTTNEQLTINSIGAKIEDVEFNVTPSTKATYEMSTDTYYNVVSLLDTIDKNNEINASIAIDNIIVDVCFNLKDLTVVAKTQIFGQELYVKYVDEVIYLSILGFNGYVNVNDIEKITEKLQPILGDDLDLGDIAEIDIAEIIDSIQVTDTNTLNISAELFGFNALIAFDKNERDLALDSITLSSNDINLTATPANKANYLMSTGKYYDLVSLLDVIDDNGQITLDLAIENVNIKATLDLTDMSLRAKLEDLEIYALLNTGDIYARYPGVLAYVNLNDIDDILTTLKPLIDKFAGEGTIPEINLDGGLKIDVETLLSTVKVVESADVLSISLDFEGVGVTANFDCNGQNLLLNNVCLDVEDLSITARPDYVPLNFTFDLNLDYINLKALVDDFGNTLVEVLTSNELYVSASASIDLGNGTVYNVKEITIQIDNLDTAPRGNATFTLEIIENGTVTSTHAIRLVYLDPSLVAVNTPNVYFTYDNKADTKVFEGTFNTEKAETTLDILKQIYTNMPIIQNALKPFLVPDENGAPTMPESTINLAVLFNSITYVANVISIDLRGSELLENMPSSIKANLTNVDDYLVLDIPALSLDSLTLTFNAGIKAADEGSITDETFAYTPSNPSDFSSINELLETFMNTTQHRSFHITGKVNAAIDIKITTININDKIDLDIKLDMDAENNVYASIAITRAEFDLAWSDKGGTATIFYDPIDNLIYIYDMHYVEEKTGTILGFIPKYEKVKYENYYKYTIDEFMADIINILLNDVLHMSSTIKDAILGAEPKTSEVTPTIENTFLGYSYDSTKDIFNVNLDLEPLTVDIQKLNLQIGHDENMYVDSLYATCGMVSLIELRLNASIVSPYNQYQGVKEALTTQKNSGNYN